MNRLRAQLPPVSSLLAFETAGRLLSFTRAAAELNVTQAAISRQMRTLEDHLGCAMFHRRHRAVQLTADGTRLHQAITMGLNHIAVTTAELQRASRGAQLAIGSTLAFAAFWLMPRLTRFRAEFPEVELRLISSDKNLDFTGDGVDVAFRYGDGNWPGATATLLFEEEVFPVCSPGFLHRHPRLTERADLADCTQLDVEGVDPSWMTWDQWLASSGVHAEHDRRRVHFNNYPLLVQAAVDGHGLALGWRYYVDDLLLRGALVRPIPATLRSGRGFYLVLPEAAAVSADIRTFRDWLLRNLGNT
jgi:LysR family transcriptional regulator, glycine cleavage system transcriptional activator